MSADISDAETEAAVDSAELAGMVESNPELEVMSDLLEEGREIAGRYRIIRHLGSGGMGKVYLAEHTAIAKQVALKTLSLEFARRRILRERFLREARSASQIRHPNVVDITDFGSTEEGAPFIVMELLDGEDLKQTLEREGRLPFEEAREIAVQICRALQAAHDKGIVHRDVKPANCFRIKAEGDSGGGPEIVKMVDFGIAKTMAAEGDSTELTKTGVIIGTAAYMAPEQARGDSDVDPRADVYSVGVLLFRMLTGETPYHSQTPLGMITKHLTDPIPSLREVAPDAGLSEGVEAVVRKALAKEREDRWQSAAELGDALARVEELELSKPTVAVPVLGSSHAGGLRTKARAWLWGGASLALAIGGVLAFTGPNSSGEAHEGEAEPGLVVETEAHELAAEDEVVRVVLHGAPAGARVYIGEREVALAGEPFELDKSSETVSLRVSAPGYLSSSLAVVPLADLDVPVTLEPEPAGAPELEPASEPEPEPAPEPEKRPQPKKKKKKKKTSGPNEPKIDREIGF